MPDRSQRFWLNFFLHRFFIVITLILILVTCFFESFQQKVLHEFMAMGRTGLQFHGVLKIGSPGLSVLYMADGKQLRSCRVANFFVEDALFALDELTCVDHPSVLSQPAAASQDRFSWLFCFFFWLRRQAQTTVEVADRFLADYGQLQHGRFDILRFGVSYRFAF